MNPMMVENAKVMAKGQITIPVDIRRTMNISEGDRLTFIAKGEYAVVMNSAIYAMRALQGEMTGKFEQMGLGSDDAVDDYVAALRAETAFK